jgi:hypothetical protein
MCTLKRATLPTSTAKQPPIALFEALHGKIEALHGKIEALHGKIEALHGKRATGEAGLKATRNGIELRAVVQTVLQSTDRCIRSL